MGSFTYERTVNFHEVGGQGTLHDHQAIQLVNEAIREFLRAQAIDLPMLRGTRLWRTKRFSVFYRAPAVFDQRLIFTVVIAALEKTAIQFAVTVSQADGGLVCLEAEARWQQVDPAGTPRPISADLAARLAAAAN